MSELRFEVVVEAERGIARVSGVSNALNSLGANGETAGRKAGSAMDDLFTKTFKLNQALELAKKAFNFLSTPIKDFFTLGMTLEDLQKRFVTILQDAKKGKDAFAWVLDFAAVTPFQFEELSQAFLLLESFGIKGKQYLETFGDTAAALKIPMQDLGLVMGQIFSKPKAQTEEMLQLIERGVPVSKILKEELGLTAKQIGDIGREGIEGKKVFEALAAGMKKYYGGAMAEMSKTGSGILSTLKDNVTLFVGQIAGGALETLKEKMTALNKQIDTWAADGTLKKIAADVSAAFSSIIDTAAAIGKTLYEWRDTIVIVGEAFLLYFAVNKILSIGSAFNSAFSASSSMFGVFYSELKVLPAFFTGLRAEGMTTGAALKTSFSTFGESMKAAGLSIGGLADKIRALPAAVQITLAFVGLELIDGLVNKIEAWTGFKYQSTGEFLGVFKYVVDTQQAGKVLADSLVIGPIVDKAKTEIDSVFTTLEDRFKVTGEEAKTLADAFDIEFQNKDQLLRDLSDVSDFFVTLRDKSGLSEDQIKQLLKTIDSRDLNFSTDREEINKLVQSFVYLNEQSSQIPDAFKKIGNLGGVLNTMIKDGVDILSKYLEKQETHTGLTKEQLKVYETLAGKLKILTGEGYKSLSNEVTIFTALLKKEFGQIETNQKSIGTAIDMIADWIELYKNAGKDIPPELQKIYEKLLSIREIEPPKIRKYKLSDFFDLQIDEDDIKFDFGNDPVEVDFQIKPVVDTGFTAVIKGAIQDVIDKMTGWASVINSTGSLLSGLGIISEGVSRSLSTVGQGISTIISGLGQFNKDGATLFDKISGGLTAFTGAVGIASTAVSLFIDLFTKTDWKRYASDMLAPISTATDAMVEKLADLSEQMGSTQRAYNALMGEFISEANIQSRDQFVEWINEVHRLVANMANGGSIEDLESAFSALAAQGEKFGILGKEFQYLVSKIQASGVQLASLDQFFQGQLDKAATGLEAYVKIATDSQTSFDNAVNMTLATFNNILARGGSIVDAIGAMGGSLDTLFEAAIKNGFNLGDAFSAVVDLKRKIGDNEDLIAGIEGLNSSLEAMANLGLVDTQDAFDDFQESASSAFDKLIAAGFDSNDALKIIAPTLDNLRVLQGQYGYTIDDTTQSLIDQADEQGLLHEQVKSENEIIIDLLAAIADALGAKIPGYLSDLSTDVGEKVPGMTKLSQDWVDSVAAVGDELDAVTDAIDEADIAWTKAVVGNTIVATNRVWQSSLFDVKDSLKSILPVIIDIDDTSKKYMPDYSELIEQLSEIPEFLKGIFPGEVPGAADFPSGLLSGWYEELYGVQSSLDLIGEAIKNIKDTSEANMPNYSLFYNQLDSIATLLGIDIPADLTTIADIWAWLNEQVGGDLEELTTLWDHFSPERYNIVTPEMRVEDTEKFKDLVSIWVEYGDTIAADQEALQQFYDDLAALNVTPEQQAAFEQFLAMIGANLDAFSTTTATWNGLTFQLGDTFSLAGETFSRVTSSMISDEVAFQGYLDSLCNSLGLTIPDEITGLGNQWDWVMSQMGLSADSFVVNTEGQIQLLSDAIRQLGRDLTDESGFTSQWGIYTEEEKQAMSVKFEGMRKTWADNRQFLLDSPTNMAKFYADLQKLVVTDDMKGKYDTFLDSIRQWNAHVQRNDKFDENTRTWIVAPKPDENEAEEEEPPTTSRRTTTYRPPTPTTTTETGTATGSTTTGTATSTGGDTFNFYITLEGTTIEDIARELFNYIRDNKYGLRTAVKAVAAEERARYSNA
jgi:tape measure domain-containing protein